EVVTHYVAVNLATAHPHIDADGTVYNLGTSYTTSLGPQLRIVKFLGGHLEQASIVASVPSRWKTGLPYFHSFAMTPNYWVFIEQPLVLFFKNLVLNYVTNNKLMDALKWMPEEHLYFHVIERSTGRSVPIKYTADSLIILHHINAWEEDGHLILDVTANDEGKYLTTFYFNNIEKEVTDASKVIVTSRIRRFVLPLSLPDETHKNVNLIKLENTRCSAVRTSKSSVHCTPTVLWNEGFELPRINYKKNGLPYRYVYGVSIGQDLTFEKLVKLEVNTGRAWLYSEKDCVVTEPIFVAAPDAVDEDDGVILSSLLRGNDPHYVALLVLDARDLTETARAEFRAEGQ
ncbi:Beta,beta-carotene 15,15'-dioxygenase-like 2, partial [Homarus americanus]